MVLVLTSRENIWNTLVSVEPSCPLTAASGNCRNRHGRHWAAFSWLDVSAISQHTWRYGRPISITYTWRTNQHHPQHVSVQCNHWPARVSIWLHSWHALYDTFILPKKLQLLTEDGKANCHQSVTLMITASMSKCDGRTKSSLSMT